MRAYKLLPHLYPASFRAEYENEMCVIWRGAGTAPRAPSSTKVTGRPTEIYLVNPQLAEAKAWICPR